MTGTGRSGRSRQNQSSIVEPGYSEPSYNGALGITMFFAPVVTFMGLNEATFYQTYFATSLALSFRDYTVVEKLEEDI